MSQTDKKKGKRAQHIYKGRYLISTDLMKKGESINEGKKILPFVTKQADRHNTFELFETLMYGYYTIQ